MADAGDQSEEKISTIEKLMKRLDDLGDGDFVYRGQANAKWRLKSGAVRRVQGKTKAGSDQYPDPDDVQDYILELVSDARSLGLQFHGGTRDHCSDLKVLAELQHHGAATNLLDFSRNVLIALWMVCSEEFDQDGRIFVANLLDEEFEELNVKDVGIITIAELFRKSNIQIWTPERFVARIQSQSSVFLIAPDESRIKFDSILVDKACKEELLSKLKKRFGLTEVQVYPDLAGFAKANRAQMPCYDRHANHYVKGARKAAGNEDMESARRLFDKAEKVGPKNVYVFFKRGLFRKDLGDFAGAIEDYDKVIKLNPNSVGAYNNRGNLRNAQGDPEGAREDYDMAIKLNPDDANAYLNKALLLEKMGKIPEAIACCKTYIRLAPDDPDGPKMLARLEEKLKG